MNFSFWNPREISSSRAMSWWWQDQWNVTSWFPIKLLWTKYCFLLNKFCEYIPCSQRVRTLSQITWSSCVYQNSAKFHSSLRDICWPNHRGMILEGVRIEQNIKNIRTSAVRSILSEKIKKNHDFDFVNLFYLYKFIIKIFPH